MNTIRDRLQERGANSYDGEGFEENSVLLRGNFRELGGCYREIMLPDGKHHPQGLPDPAPVVEFLVSSAGQI
ncbi:hypothetical protein [Coraliomargarita parva]|uniref:hypothetical protein n=1 Tax=Coraliomargarita parva TaxID=3014050 RepID=UPI0022B3C257|nr:hypothetical protein [Coraliomargarita parva]